MRSQTARSRASMLHDATTPGPAADAKSRPPDSQPARIEEAERAVGAPASLRRGPGRGLVPALDQVGEGVKARGVRGRAVAGVVSCRVPGHAECPVTGRDQQCLASELVQLRSARPAAVGRQCRVHHRQQPRLHRCSGLDQIGHLVAVPDPPVLAGPPGPGRHPTGHRPAGHRLGERTDPDAGRWQLAQHGLQPPRPLVPPVPEQLGVVGHHHHAWPAARGRPGVVVVAYDTELFGHWWYEGPWWLEAVLRQLPSAGVRVGTLAQAVAGGAVAGRVDLPAGSWGSGKDWRVWAGDQVADLVETAAAVQARLLAVVDAALPADRGRARRPELDQLAREALLVTASDWAFCVTRDSAADYARHRAATHTARFHALADLIECGDEAAARSAAEACRRTDGPFGFLDARRL